jgi:hypothetical protein
MATTLANLSAANILVLRIVGSISKRKRRTLQPWSFTRRCSTHGRKSWKWLSASSGEYSASQFHFQQKQASEITTKMLHARKIVSAVRAQIQDLATRVYHEQLFSHHAETIFQQYQQSVDALLSSTASSAFGKLPHAFERLGAGDAEAISHALATCRRVVDAFADSVYPARGDPVKLGEQTLEVGHKQVRNRLRAYMYEHLGQCSRYERLNKTLGSLYDRVSTGVHSEVDSEEARALVLQTYLFLGELLSLPGGKLPGA